MRSPSFSYVHPLPSLRVTKGFLLALEQFLLKRAFDASLLSQDQAQEAIRIRIKDGLGTENLRSMSQLEAARFAESTEEIEISLDSPYRNDGTKLAVRLHLSKGRLFSSMSIDATGPNARETVLGLKEGLLRMVEPQRTWHWLCHPTAPVWGALFAFDCLLGYLLFMFKGADPSADPRFHFVFSAFIAILVYMSYVGSIRPYTVFDSRGAERADKIWSWLIGGISTFIVFGTLLTLVRRPLLGF